MDKLPEVFRDMKISGITAPSSQEKLIIALDFGTTYSGVAYCFASQRDPQPSAVVHWPDSEAAPKTPTLISYETGNPSSFKWGASANRQPDPSQQQPIFLPGNINRDLKALPKPPVEVAADFIRALYQHALSAISATVPKMYLATCQKEFVMSAISASWSDAAKNATLRAAETAGMSPVTLIKEPEAAALYTFKSLGFCVSCSDTFVLCDAGGGTVDLVSYEVESVLPRLEVKELVPGTGGMAGSLGLNERFRYAVRELVGEEKWLELSKSKAYSLAEKQFDQEIKRQFRDKSDEEYFVNFPMANLDDDVNNGLESNSWRLTGDKLKEIFDPLITDILRLIEQQVQSIQIKRGKKGVTGICLVGGFGSSQYLKDRVQKENPDIQVLQPNDAWAAIKYVFMNSVFWNLDG
ncbi:hypothetical protein TPAR_02793 [Tolypocladium paradoxum]|uniref:Actin-like ATPase domain-containing protein n=1 Tax=Tolypocladium paradoxum TaxID=94208 RepID=A0A2S4L3L5_9HYPO|nr:hypothetical protein TPAR_02793 [Tolypocladium paradoxum]